MNIEDAIRLTEILLGFAFVQQSIEHILAARDERILFIPRLILAIILIIGIQSAWVILMLMALGLAILNRFQGPYNGGADRMSLLALSCLLLVHWLPSPKWQEIAFAYLAVQLMLSYFISGWVKLVNQQWRSGQALVDVFLFSAYPVSESLRRWSSHRNALLLMSWVVIIFELSFPFTIMSAISLKIALIVAALFHLANAFLFGLNRFFWVWIAAYPSILWFQQRIFDTI